MEEGGPGSSRSHRLQAGPHGYMVPGDTTGSEGSSRQLEGQRSEVSAVEAPLPPGTLGTDESPRESTSSPGLALCPSQTGRSTAQTSVSRTCVQQDLARPHGCSSGGLPTTRGACWGPGL